MILGEKTSLRARLRWAGWEWIPSFVSIGTIWAAPVAMDLLEQVQWIGARDFMVRSGVGSDETRISQIGGEGMPEERTFTSGPNAFPTPPRGCCPTRVERFTIRGPIRWERGNVSLGSFSQGGALRIALPWAGMGRPVGAGERNGNDAKHWRHGR